MKSNYYNQEKNNFITSKLKSYSNKAKCLSYYDIIFVEVDNLDRPIICADQKSFHCFTSKELATRVQSSHDLVDLASDNYSLPKRVMKLRPYMLGDLVFSLCDSKNVKFIRINPVLVIQDEKEIFLHEEIIFVPLKDKLTEKYMLTSPEEGIALLALNPEDQKRMGMEMVFYCVTNKNLPESYEEREAALERKIEELSFIGPRVPIKKGSGSLLCIILNLENAMEETAFIRNYKTLDDHSNVIFVTSDLKIKTGDLHQINYDGDSIDTIFGPIINWQRGLNTDMRASY
jgi:hypothetical protein